MATLDPVKKWIFSIGLKKGAVSLAKLIVAFATAKGVSFVAVIGGIQIDITDIGIMTAAINSALTVLRNWLKIKWPEKFGFL